MGSRVLIIDDEANIWQMVGLVLETAGYQVGPSAPYFKLITPTHDWPPEMETHDLTFVIPT